MSSSFFDFSLEPGRELKKINYKKKDPIVSIVMPYYNDKKSINQTINSILNQTFPFYEVIIVDDGSTDKESVEKLEEIKALDERIKVFHKENAGPAVARDFGADKSSDKSKYLFFLDSDDLIEPTYLECAYWTLETNKKAAWAYTDSVGFEEVQYTWNKWFDSKRMKKENDLVACALIRKEAFYDVGCFGIKEKGVYEDWNLWLKMMAKGYFPVRMNFYGFWYRRKTGNSELKRSSATKEKKQRAMAIINETTKTIKKKVTAIQYPRNTYNWSRLREKMDNILCAERESDNKKIRLLLIIPWMTTGGADKFNIDFLAGLDKEKFEAYVITTEPQINNYRQEVEKYATVYDLTTFIDKKYWLAFITYLIEKEGINFILNTNSRFGYSVLPYLKAKYPETPIVDYIHMEEWYNRNGGYSRDSSGVASILDKTYLCNKKSEKILADHFGRNPEDLKTVYIGVDEKKYNPDSYTEEDKEKILEKYEIKKNGRFIISFICRISAQKRPLLLVNIIKKLKEERKDDFLFVIAGSGDMLKEMQAKVRKYNLSDNVTFLGNIKETRDIYAISDMTINCSIKEGLALTAYESLAMGIPVVSADVGGQSELINEDVGVIVPCLQKEEDIHDHEYTDEEVDSYVKGINKIIKNIDKYKKKCRKRVLNGFTIDQMKKNMSNNVLEVFNNPSKEKIEAGKGLAKNIPITKEIVTLFFQENYDEYSWECIQYNKFYFELSHGDVVTKFDRVKGVMWKHKWYRGLIKFAQKTGIVRLKDKILNREEDD